MIDFHQYGVSALPLNQGHNGLLVSSPNHRIALPVPNSAAQLNICRTFVNRTSTHDLTSALNPTGVSLFSLLLTSEIPPKSPSSSFIRIDMLIKRFMANWQLCGNLLGAELLGNPVKGGFEHIRLNASGITTTYGPLLSKSVGLLGSIPAAPFVSNNIAKNGRGTPAKILGNFGAIQSFFHEAKNLISFVLAEVFIGHGNLTLEVKKL